MKYVLLIIFVLLICISFSLVISLLIKRFSKLKKKRYVIIFTSILSIFFIFICMIGYLSIYNHANKEVKNYLKSSENVNVSKINEGYFFDGKGSDKAIIFYPGAKVEYISYAPLMYELADSGIDCFLIKMPFNMAMFGENKASKIIEKYDYESYYMAGHSLGGVVASSYANKHDEIKGVILLASYSTKNISSKDVLSIYGSNDGVINLKAYEKNKANLGKNYTEIIINGANHSQFGMYGRQKGDNEATITFTMQQQITISAIKEMVNKDEN